MNDNVVNPNRCPYCNLDSNKKLVDYSLTTSVLWCYNCLREYEVLYHRVPIEILKIEYEEDEQNGN